MTRFTRKACKPLGCNFSSSKLSTNLCFSPGRALSRSDKSFLRETDWNNGGDCALNGFLLRCSTRLSTASEEQRERGREKKAFHIMGTERESKAMDTHTHSEWKWERHLKQTAYWLCLWERVWSESAAKMHACLQRHVFRLLHKNLPVLSAT